MIYRHHKAYGGDFSSALDVGAGSGVVTKQLLRRFKRVTLSDVSELYVSQAKARFSNVQPDHKSYLQQSFEALNPVDLPHGKVDLITAGECLHFAILQDFVTQMAKMLQPDGTIAAFQYALRAIYHP